MGRHLPWFLLSPSTASLIVYIVPAKTGLAAVHLYFAEIAAIKEDASNQL
jgi:hypothetical protein